MFDPLSLLALFAPVAVQAGRSLVQKYLAPADIKPLTIDEKIALTNSDTERLKIIAEIDKPAENVSWWVSDIRALQRPIVACAVTTTWVFFHLRSHGCTPPELAEMVMVDSVAAAIWFYLFGERTSK